MILQILLAVRVGEEPKQGSMTELALAVTEMPFDFNWLKIMFITAKFRIASRQDPASVVST